MLPTQPQAGRRAPPAPSPQGFTAVDMPASPTRLGRLKPQPQTGSPEPVEHTDRHQNRQDRHDRAGLRTTAIHFTSGKRLIQSSALPRNVAYDLREALDSVVAGRDPAEGGLAD
jgi:hypothetical protein